MAYEATIELSEEEREKLQDKKKLVKDIDGLGKVIIKYYNKHAGRRNDFDLILTVGKLQYSFVRNGENIVVESKDDKRYELIFN